MTTKQISISSETPPQPDDLTFNKSLLSNSQLSSKSPSALNLHKSQLDASFNSYRYQHVPDNEYSYSQTVQNAEEGHFTDLKTVQKLQAAYMLIGFIQRIEDKATLVTFWQNFIQMCHSHQDPQQVQSPKQITIEDLKNQQLLKDFSNNPPPRQILIEAQIESNKFTSSLQQVEQRKSQILQLQKDGITLDKLSKQRLNKSESISKLLPQKDLTHNLHSIQIQQQTLSKQQVNNLTEHQRQKQKSQASRKSYRQKYEENKHRDQNLNQQKDKPNLNFNLTSFQQSYKPNHDPILNRQPQPGTWQHISFPSTSQYMQSYPYNTYGQYNGLFSYKSPAATNLNSHRSNYHLEENYPTRNILIEEQNVQAKYQNERMEKVWAEHEWIRVKLLEEISEKLRFSRFRMEYCGGKDSQDHELIRKITRLQQMVLSLKKQQEDQTNEKSEKVQSPRQGQETVRKFMWEVEQIKDQIKELKLFKENETYQRNEHRQIQDDSSVRIINEQQAMLANYQQEVQRLLGEKQAVKVSRAISQQGSEQRLIVREQQIEQKALNSYKNFSQSTVNQNIVYRRVLLDGKHEPYEYGQREEREEQIRRMTERVKQIRQSRMQSTTVKRATMNERVEQQGPHRPIRAMYEEETQRRKQEMAELREQDDECCVLLKY